MESAFFGARGGRNEGGEPAAEAKSGSAGRVARVRDGADQRTAPALEAEEDPGDLPCGPGRWEIYFANLRLGELDPSTASFIAAPWRGNQEASEPDKVLP